MSRAVPRASSAPAPAGYAAFHRCSEVAGLPLGYIIEVEYGVDGSVTGWRCSGGVHGGIAVGEAALLTMIREHDLPTT